MDKAAVAHQQGLKELHGRIQWSALGSISSLRHEVWYTVLHTVPHQHITH
jgi:hypothetical protein